ncbi:hypothetical protein [Streptomyces sp. SD15]
MYTSTRAALAAALVAAVTATAALTGAAASAVPRAAHTEPVSVTPAGKAGNASSSAAVISRDGRYTAFASTASDLVRGDTDNVSNVFVRDLRTGDVKTGTTVLVTPDTTGGTASAEVAPGAVAADARRIAFTTSDATLITGGDANDAQDVFVRKLS